MSLGSGKTILAVLLALAPAVAGCASLPVDTLKLPQVARLRGAVAAPLPVALAVAFPLEERAPRRDASEPGCWSLPLDDLDVAAETRRDLLRLGWFRDVVQVEASDPGAFCREAKARGAEYGLWIRLRDHRVAYLGANAWALPNILVWACVLVPSWYIPDETYRTEISLEGILYDTRTGRTVTSLPGEGAIRLRLADPSRGWDFFSALAGPLWTLVAGSPGQGTFLEVSLNTRLLALNLAKADLFAGIAAAAPLLTAKSAPEPVPATPGPPPEAQPAPAKPARAFAVVVGIDAYAGDHAPALSFARADAEKFAQALADRSGLEFAPGGVETAFDEAATLDGIQKALDRIAGAKPGPADTVFFYFAGLGAVSGTEKDRKAWLVPHDGATSGSVRDCLSLDRALKALAQTGAGRVVAVVDAGLSAENTVAMGGRSLGKREEDAAAAIKPTATSSVGGVKPQPPETAGIRDVLKDRKGMAVFLAAAEGGDAVEFKEADGGLFTTSVLAVLKGGQKADDAFRSSAARVSESAARYAVEQAPSFLGDGEVPVFAKR